MIKYILIAILIITTLAITACNEENTQYENTTKTELQAQCDIDKGETYCPTLDECIRVWETKCPEYEEYYIEPIACTMEYAPVTGDIVFPCEEGECEVTLEFGNRCQAEAQGAKNIEPKLLSETAIGENEYGCEINAGYTYCPTLDECIRVWETKCPEYEEYYLEPKPCTKEYMPVTGDMIFPCEEGECEVTLEFGNRCQAEAQGAKNIEPIQNIDYNIKVTNFDECVAAGNKVIDAFPRECEHNKELFHETINYEELNLSKDIYDACYELRGNPLPEHNECEHLTEESCNYLGGEYFECESACRHDPDSEICAQGCVGVCKFN